MVAHLISQVADLTSMLTASRPDLTHVSQSPILSISHPVSLRHVPVAHDVVDELLAIATLLQDTTSLRLGFHIICVHRSRHRITLSNSSRLPHPNPTTRVKRPRSKQTTTRLPQVHDSTATTVLGYFLCLTGNAFSTVNMS